MQTLGEKREVKRVAELEFSGNFMHTIDIKGRATIPSAYRELLGEDFTVGLNNDFSAIALYPARKWESISEKLHRIPDTDARGMAYVRLIKAFSFPGQTLDGQGRILLPAALREKAGMRKDVRFVGVGQYLEIWDEEKFNQVTAKNEENFDELLAYVNDRYYAPED